MNLGLNERNPEQTNPTGPPPPFVFLVFLVGALLVNLYYPLPFSSSSAVFAIVIGLCIITSGLVIGILGIRAMRKAGVSPLPWKAPSSLVTGGPFRYTRNPLYISLALYYAGISVAINSILPLIFLILPLAIVDRQVILREEKFLEGRFGEEYLNYKARVRRWI